MEIVADAVVGPGDDGWMQIEATEQGLVYNYDYGEHDYFACDLEGLPNLCGLDGSGLSPSAPQQPTTSAGGGVPTEAQNCEKKVQAAASQALGTSTTYLGPTQGPGLDTYGFRNGAYNFNFFAPGYAGGLPGDCGRVPSNIFGLGSSLHIVASPGPCNPLGDPTIYSATPGGLYFTAHMDSGNGSFSTPLGAVWHFVSNVVFRNHHGC